MNRSSRLLKHSRKQLETEFKKEQEISQYDTISVLYNKSKTEVSLEKILNDCLPEKSQMDLLFIRKDFERNLIWKTQFYKRAIVSSFGTLLVIDLSPFSLVSLSALAGCVFLLSAVKLMHCNTLVKQISYDPARKEVTVEREKIYKMPADDLVEVSSYLKGYFVSKQHRKIFSFGNRTNYEIDSDLNDFLFPYREYNFELQLSLWKFFSWGLAIVGAVQFWSIYLEIDSAIKIEMKMKSKI